MHGKWVWAMLIIVAGCRESVRPPPLVEPPDNQAPRIEQISTAPEILHGDTAQIFVTFVRGTCALSRVAMDYDGDGQWDATRDLPAWGTAAWFSHCYDSVGSMQLTAGVWDSCGLSDTASTTIRVLPFRFAILVVPDEYGVAPLLIHLRVRHEAPSDFQMIRVDWLGDGTVDTTYAPEVNESQLVHTYDVGRFPLRVEAELSDTNLAIVDTIISLNTAPSGSLPPLTVHQGEPLGPVNLAENISDAQTPATELVYEIVSQAGPATARIDSYLLVLSAPDSVFGHGEVVVSATDPHGGSVTVPQHYTIIAATTIVHLSIALSDLETDAPVTEGYVSLDARTYLVTPSQPVVEADVLQALYYRLSASRAEGSHLTSYQRTVLFPAMQDSSGVIPVITFDHLWQTTVSVAQFHDFNQQVRQIPVENDFHTSGLGSIRFEGAAAGFAAGGYTLYIEQQNPDAPGDSLSAGEQAYIEEVLNSEMLPYIPGESRRPPVYLAQAGDPTYLQNGEPEQAGLILMAKSETAQVHPFDDGADGSIDRALIYLDHNFDQVEILQSVLRALAAPAEFSAVPLPAEQTILHPQTTATELTDADQLLLTIAAKTEPGIYLDDLFRTPT
jgi:hypothetical protein